MLLLYLHRLLLFLVGATVITGAVAVIPGFVTLNKVFTGLLAASVTVQLMLAGVQPPRGAITFWVLALLLSVAFGVAISFVFGVPFEPLLILGQSYFLTIVFYFLLLFGLRSMADIRALLWGLTISATITSASVLLGFRSGWAALDPTGRTGGLAGDPNYFALGASIGLAVSAFLAMSSRWWSTRLLLAGLMAVMAAGAVSSLSRGGYLALAVMVALFIYRFGVARQLKFLVPVLIVIAILPLVLPQRVIERVETLTTRPLEDTAVQSRIFQYQRAFEMFRSSPVWGVGLHRSSLAPSLGGAVSRQDLRAPSWQRGRYSVIHNSYLILAAELGLLGLIPYLVVTLLAWLGYSRVWMLRRGADPEDRATWELVHLAVMLQIALCGAIVAGMFLNATLYKATWLLFALSPVVTSIAGRSTTAKPETATGPRWQRTRA